MPNFSFLLQIDRSYLSIDHNKELLAYLPADQGVVCLHVCTTTSISICGSRTLRKQQAPAYILAYFPAWIIDQVSRFSAILNCCHQWVPNQGVWYISIRHSGTIHFRRQSLSELVIRRLVLTQWLVRICSTSLQQCTSTGAATAAAGNSCSLNDEFCVSAWWIGSHDHVCVLSTTTYYAPN